MIDSYLIGRSDRMSPEADIPVVVQESTEDKLGGAANVALNLRALGCTVELVSVIGDDDNGQKLIQLLDQNNISPNSLVIDDLRKTTQKLRVFAGHSPVVRIDDEDTHNLSDKLLKQVISKCLPLLEKVDGLIFQDYDKGVISETLITPVLKRAKELNIKVIVDPKECNYFNFKGVSLFKPNLREFQHAHNITLNIDSDNKGVKRTLQGIRKDLQCGILLLTLSSEGLIIISEDNYYRVPAIDINLVDVSGAGDTVIAVAALGLLLDLPVLSIAEICNMAGGLACEQFGVVPIGSDHLLSRINSEFVSK